VKTKLCPRTLRWVSRRLRRSVRNAEACWEEAVSRTGKTNSYDAAYYQGRSHGASNMALMILATAKRLEKARVK
jgi:hypothetical protein